ncbi:protein starmaker-like isoform X1, partial [Biomphalaria pfeifferi]
CRADEIPKVVDSDPLKPFSNDELGEKIKDLLDTRPELPDIELEFDDLFENLNSLSLRMPPDFEFRVTQFGPKDGNPLLQNAKAMKCLSSNDQLKHFLNRVKEAFKGESSEDKSDDQDDKKPEVSDNKKNDTSDEVDNTKKESQDQDNDHTMKKRDTNDEKIDWEDVLEELETEDLECLTGFVTDREEKFLCSRLARGSAGVFARILAGGFECDDHLEDSDEEHDVSHEAIDDLLDDQAANSKLLGNDDQDSAEHHLDSISLDDLLNEESSEAVDDILKEIEELADGVLDSGESLGEVLDDLVEVVVPSDDTKEKTSLEVSEELHKVVLGDRDENDRSREISIEISKDVIIVSSKENTERKNDRDDDDNDDDDNDHKKDDDDDDSHDDYDDKDDNRGRWRSRLSQSHQIAILQQLKAKGSSAWTDDDVKRILRVAPDVIDDDFLEELPEKLFDAHMKQFARMAMSQHSNPLLRYTLREKLDDDMDKMTAERLRQIGPALMSLRFDQIQQLDGKLLLEVDVDDILDDDDDDKDDDSKEKSDKVRNVTRKADDDGDDDDDDEKEIVRFSLGQRIKASLNTASLSRPQLRSAMRYLYDDLDFVRSVKPDDLLDALKDISDLDYDDDDARAVFSHMALSSHFPPISKMTGSNLTAMGHLIRGLGVYQMADLQREALEESLDKIKDIDFDDDQAEVVFQKVVDEDEVETLSLERFRKLGKLVKGMPTGQLMKIKSDVIDDLLDDLDDVDLNDAQKRVIAGMALQNKHTQQKFLKLQSFTEVVSVTDLDDLDDDDIFVYMNRSAKLDWSHTQAAVLAHTYIQKIGEKKFKPSDIGTFGHVAIGLYPDDMDDLMKTEDDVLDLADELKDIEDDLTSGQIDELVDSFEDITEMETKAFEVDELKAVRGAHIIAYLSHDKFDKLRFTAGGKTVFISQMSKMATDKMSREHMHYLATALLKMMDEDDSKEIKMKFEDRDSKRLRSLGQLTLGLSPDQIKKFSGSAIMDNLDILRTLPWSKSQAETILDKIDDVIEKWHCRPDIMARLGPILLHDDNPLSDDCDWEVKKSLLGSFKVIMKGLEKRNEIIKERLEEGFSREDNDDDDDDAGEKRLVNAIVILATQTTKPISRRRRAVPGAPLTCEILMMLRGSANQVDPQTLTAMKDEDFKNCLSTLGAISDWSAESLTTLVNKAKQVLNETKQWTNGQIKRLGSLVSGLVPTEIQDLQLTGVDAMNSIGKHGRLSTEQLRAGFLRWMNLTGKQNVKQITPGEFSSLSEFLCALDVSEIEKIDETSFKRLVEVIGRTVSCTPPQHGAYVKKAFSIFGADVSLWHPAVVGDMGVLLAGFSPDQIKSINSKQLSLIQPKVIPRLPNDIINAFTVDQLKALSTNQANAVTDVQYKALTADQQKILDSKASVMFSSHVTSTSQPKNDGHNGVALTSYSIAAILSALLISLL